MTEESKNSFFYIDPQMRERALRGKEISDSVKTLTLSVKLRPMELIKPKKGLNYDTFQDCLDIYENNQRYYADDINELRKLEQWFSAIREPYPVNASEMELDEWRKRERNRKRNGISDYCDENVRALLS